MKENTTTIEHKFSIGQRVVLHEIVPMKVLGIQICPDNSLLYQVAGIVNDQYTIIYVYELELLNDTCEKNIGFKKP